VMAAAVLAAAAVPALADDLTPPPWRFNPGTTFQHWDFSGGPAGGPADAGLFNPYGVPMLTPALGAIWLPALGARNDVWQLGGATGQTGLRFDVPNTGVQTNQKELWLQITYLSPVPGGPPGWTVFGSSGLFTLLGAPISTTTSDGWTHELTRWGVASCPSFEQVAVFPSIPGTTLFVDQVVIDTRCAPIPAPASAVLLCASPLVVARRRR
jgi:hypothetical protein